MSTATRTGDVATRLSITVEPVPGEWLPSLIGRIAAYLGQAPTNVTRWCGLTADSSYLAARLGNTASPQARQKLAAILRWDAEALDASTMDSFREVVFNRRPDGNPSQSKDWTRGIGTRYCPECLRENPGVYHAHWRLWWSFVCTKHALVLRDSCAECGGLPEQANHLSAHAYDPSMCRHRIEGEGPCEFDLADSWAEEPLAHDSQLLATQRAIEGAWRPDPDAALSRVFNEDAKYTGYFRSLRGAGIALLKAGDASIIAELSGVAEEDFVGYFEKTDRTGTTAPKEAFFMGVLMAAAHELQTAPEGDVTETIRYITFSTPVTASTDVMGPGSAAHLLSFWPNIGTALRGRVLRALDADLPPIQRLIWGTAMQPEIAALADLANLHRPGATTPDGRIINRSDDKYVAGLDARVPPLLWPSWANPLGVDPNTEPSTLQRSLTDAVRIAAIAGRTIAGPNARDIDLISGIGRKLRPEMLGDEEQTRRVLRQLTGLATLLRLQPPPVNWERRRHLAYWTLLPAEHWTMIAESVDEDPGRGPKLLRAKRYMFLRATGAGTRDLPKPWRIKPSTHDAADYSDFLTSMSAELAQAMDDYLAEWLRLRGDQEDRRGLLTTPSDPGAPVFWEPPRWFDDEPSPGFELDDIDIDQLHHRVRGGQLTITNLASGVRRLPRHVRWALSASPLPSGNVVQAIDWSKEIVPTEHFVLNNEEALRAWAEDGVPFGLQFG